MERKEIRSNHITGPHFLLCSCCSLATGILCCRRRLLLVYFVSRMVIHKCSCVQLVWTFRLFAADSEFRPELNKSELSEWLGTPVETLPDTCDTDSNGRGLSESSGYATSMVSDASLSGSRLVLFASTPLLRASISHQLCLCTSCRSGCQSWNLRNASSQTPLRNATSRAPHGSRVPLQSATAFVSLGGPLQSLCFQLPMSETPPRLRPSVQLRLSSLLNWHNLYITRPTLSASL